MKSSAVHIVLFSLKERWVEFLALSLQKDFGMIRLLPELSSTPICMTLKLLKSTEYIHLAVCQFH